MVHDIAALIRKSYACYPAKDRATHESLLAEDFHFSSPYDDRIDRAEYFRRCWPNADKVQAVHIDALFVDGEIAAVRYTLTPSDGKPFHNMELVRTRDGKIVEVEVYFGELPKKS